MINRYISGKTATNLSEVTGNEILILDAYSIFVGLDIIKNNRPIAAIAEDKYIFSHVSSFLQMLDIPLFFVSNRMIEKLSEYASLTIDLLQNEVSHTTKEQEELPVITRKIRYNGDDTQVLSSLKSVNLNNSLNYGADGVGLISTEFVFYETNDKLSKENQYKTFDRIFYNQPSLEYTIRLFDITEDKVPMWSKIIWENHKKKKHGGRLLFSNEFNDVFVQQIKSIVLLSKKYSVSLLIPYFTSPDEIEKVRNTIFDMCSDCTINVGVMIETVAAIDDMKSIIDKVDFFSVGSNDLVQSYFGINRTNIEDDLSRISLNSSFWNKLGNIIENAESKPVRVCGQLPIAPTAISQLLELGYRYFTVHPLYIQYLKNKIKKEQEYAHSY